MKYPKARPTRVLPTETVDNMSMAARVKRTVAGSALALGRKPRVTMHADVKDLPEQILSLMVFVVGECSRCAISETTGRSESRKWER